MNKFLRFILCVLKSRRNFEAVQAYLGLFLKLHSEIIMDSDEMIETIGEIQAEQVRQIHSKIEFKIRQNPTNISRTTVGPT